MNREPNYWRLPEIYNYAEVKIRRAELSEVDLVKSILNDAYAPVKKQLSRAPAALKEDLGKISRHIQMGNQYVALVGNQVVGTMRVTQRGQVGVIERLAVSSEFRNRRIGTMLVQHAENLMEGMDALCIELEVYGRVEEQQKFYDRIGYKETTREKRSGEVIVLMRKIFNEEVEEEEPL